MRYGIFTILTIATMLFCNLGSLKFSIADSFIVAILCGLIFLTETKK